MTASLTGGLFDIFVLDFFKRPPTRVRFPEGVQQQGELG
jgi:hypothetical protein